MKLAGFLLLVTGWGIVLSALVLLASPPLRSAFVLAGITIEVLGLTFAARAHSFPREQRE